MKCNGFHNGLVPPLNSSCQKPMMENFETKITLVPNRFKLSLLPSYVMLFVSDEAWLFIFQGSFDKGSQHEQLLLLSCTALCIYDRDSYHSVCFIYSLQLHTAFNYIFHDFSIFSCPILHSLLYYLHTTRIFPSFNIQKSKCHHRLTFH